MQSGQIGRLQRRHTDPAVRSGCDVAGRCGGRRGTGLHRSHPDRPEQRAPTSDTTTNPGGPPARAG